MAVVWSTVVPPVAVITVVVMAVVTTALDDSSTILLVVFWLAVTSATVVVAVGEMASCDVESEGGNSGPSFTIKQTHIITHMYGFITYTKPIALSAIM